MIQIILGYIKQHRKGMFLFGICSLIFALVFSLYRLEAEAVFYAVLLCLSFIIVIGGIDFVFYYNRHKNLERAGKVLKYRLEQLPKPGDLIEEDYQQLIQTLYQDKRNSELSKDKSYSEMIEYYSIWAHQIKTPIAAMRLMLQSDEAAKEELLLELSRIDQYVEMVLTYLRLDSGSTDFVMKEYKLERILKEAVKKSAPFFIRKKISLQMEPVNMTVLTDEKWLLFVIEQILSNSLKYSPKGKISIYEEPDKVLVIEDNGIGIAKEDLPRIFEKGFTGYNGREHKKATGIGLYLCKRVLTNLSHSITIDSSPGAGTKVRLYLKEADVLVKD